MGSPSVLAGSSAVHTPHPRSAELFTPGAEWMASDATDECGARRCRKRFSFLVGKHHCRWCGGVFCDACSPRTAPHGGGLYRCCNACRLPVVLRSFVSPRTGQRESGPLQCILSFLTPRSITALLQSCYTMLSEFPLADCPYRPSIQHRFPSFYDGAIIGRGGFGTVYKCEDRRSADHRYVAIKRMEKCRTLTFSMWGKALTELEVLRAATHRNVAAVIEVFQTTTDLVVVMEAGDGGTARQACDYIHQHQLPVEPFVASLVVQVAEGLHYLYTEMHIVHRDVKLENIVLSADYSRVMLIDFGLAEYVQCEAEQAYVAAGTSGYASPENIIAVVEGKSTFRATGLTMHKADIFSLGVVAYMILTLHRPLGGKRFRDQHAELTEGISCQGRWWDDRSVLASELVASMLSVPPEQRPDYPHIRDHKFVAMFLPRATEIANFRKAAQARDDEEGQQWVLVDPASCLPGPGHGDSEQFPVQRRGFVGSLLGLWHGSEDGNGCNALQTMAFLSGWSRNSSRR